MSRYAGRHRSASDTGNVPPVPPRTVAAALEPGSTRVAALESSAGLPSGPASPTAPRSRARRVVRVVGGAAAVSLLGVGAVSSMSLAKVADHGATSEKAAALTLPVDQQGTGVEAVAYQATTGDLASDRTDARGTVKLELTAGISAARGAERQAAAKAAADAQAAAAAKAAADAQAAQAAQAAADAAAADAARQAETDRVAREAERQSVASAAAKADPRSTAKGMLAGFGWSDSQFSCLDSLWTKESGWNPLATNASSGAYGIPQSLPASKMATAGADYRTNPATQITWGLTYIKASYGSPCSAWAHSQAVNWY